MIEYRDVLERELERLTPPRIPVDRLRRRRDRRRRNERIAAGLLAAAVSLAALAGLVRAFSAPDTGDPSPTPRPSIREGVDVRFVDVGSGRTTPMPRSIREVPSVQSVRVSPDGSMLAFEGARTQGSFRQIYVANVDGTAIRRLTPARDWFDATNPGWSPDGSSIVYEGNDHGTVDLYIVDASSGETTRVTRGLIGAPLLAELTPSFSADGRTILYTLADEDSVGLWTISVDGGDRSLLMRGAAFGSYSPDGTTLAFRKATVGDGFSLGLSQGISFADADGSHQRTGPGAPGISMSFLLVVQPDAATVGWSPGSRRIVYLDPFSPHTVSVWDLDDRRGTAIERWGTQASWFDDDTLIVARLESP